MFGICHGKSMPNFHGLGFVRTKKSESYNIDDIVVLKGHDKKLYVHRLIVINGDKVTAKGDRHHESKPYEIDVPITNIKAKVVWMWPK